MAKIRDIQRTAAFAWSPDTQPFIATGTQAGAVSADFSDNTQLELWDLNLGGNSQAELSPVASVSTDSKFYDIAWGRLSNDRPRGIIAGALENGSLDLWSADALVERTGNPLISQTSKHSGAIKSLQFNPFKSELLATAGAKGELYVWDLNNTDNPFMLGNKVARADDFDCLDWNKKVPHILVTGGSGGFLTVWDVKMKKESLTLNNLNRKAVSAVAWHPDQQTKLITAVPDDQNPVILLWDLRNSNAPERTLTGHSAGVLSLSWCKQDSDLLLSCGKDNRSICWNPQTGEMLGEFPVVTNWTFKTNFHPRNPSYIATASYDGKIAVRTLQNTNPQADAGAATATDDDDFFSRASNAQTSSFTLKQTPKWLKRPAGATFGFGGKLVSFSYTAAHQSKVKISTVAIDSGMSAATERFEKAIAEGNLVAICQEKAQDAKSEAEKSEWSILRTLFETDTKAKLVEHLGFKAEDIKTLDREDVKDESTEAETEEGAQKANRLSSFFGDSEDDSENFLASLSIESTQTAKTNNPFQIYTGTETEADRAITKAVVLGEYERAVDVCLKEDRLSDAFMLAISGGSKCIDKVKAAYFIKKHNGPNYLRLLASVVGKNMWDVVHNADIANWKEVVVALCTHADDSEFKDLCEALGDRLEEEFRSKKESKLLQAASLCYLTGSKLHKVVKIWISEFHDDERAGLQEASEDSTFSVHARSLQNFIEKVTIFREAVKFVDEEKSLPSGWKLNALYERYCEYADIVASHGHLNIAGKYLDLLPSNYPAAMVARNRIKQATTQTTTPTAAAATTTTTTTARKAQQPTNVAYRPQAAFQPVQPVQPATTGYAPPVPTLPNPYQPSKLTPTNIYAPPGQMSVFKPNPYQPAAPAPTGPYAPPYPGGTTFTPTSMALPPRQFPPPPSAPPKQGAATNWNDTPEVVRPSRRSTPAAQPQPSVSPFPGAPPRSPPQPGLPWNIPPPRATPPPPPPPPKSAQPPQRVQSPAGYQPRPASPAIPTLPQNPYASGPPQPAPNSGRYTPQQAAQSPLAGPPVSRAGLPQGGFVPGPTSSGPRYAPPPAMFGQASAPSPYAPQQQAQAAPSPYAPHPGQQPSQSSFAPPPQSSFAPPPQSSFAPPPQSSFAPPPQSSFAPPPSSSAPPPPQNVQGPPPPRPASQQASASSPKPAVPPPQPIKHPKGDRSHISAQHMPIFELLSADMERVKARAPPNFSRQVGDTEKRLNILFDHINNQELLSDETLAEMNTLARALASRDYVTAHTIQVNLMTNKTSECAQWMTGVKRLVEMSRVSE